jgi:hypothetical protein
MRVVRSIFLRKTRLRGCDSLSSIASSQVAVNRWRTFPKATEMYREYTTRFLDIGLAHPAILSFREGQGRRFLLKA